MQEVILDTETTGLLKASSVSLDEQPKIIELFCLKVIDDVVVDKFHTMIDPELPLPDIITKITGITDKDVKGQKKFIEVYDDLCSFFLGTDVLVAHNASYDVGMLANDLRRIDKLLNFPWPKEHYCTVEHSMHLKGHRLKLSELYYIATGNTEIVNAHRAENDVMALWESYKWLRGK